MNNKIRIALLLGFGIMALTGINALIQSPEELYYNENCFESAEAMEQARNRDIWTHPELFAICLKICNGNGFETADYFDLSKQQCFCK